MKLVKDNSQCSDGRDSTDERLQTQIAGIKRSLQTTSGYRFGWVERPQRTLKLIALGFVILHLPLLPVAPREQLIS